MVATAHAIVSSTQCVRVRGRSLTLAIGADAFCSTRGQVFHTVFHTDQNVLVGAPTGSGKTGIAEVAVMRLLRAHPGMKAVYVAPLKALVRERMDDWGDKFVRQLGFKLQELTGGAAC